MILGIDVLLEEKNKKSNFKLNIYLKAPIMEEKWYLLSEKNI